MGSRDPDFESVRLLKPHKVLYRLEIHDLRFELAGHYWHKMPLTHLVKTRERKFEGPATHRVSWKNVGGTEGRR